MNKQFFRTIMPALVFGLAANAAISGGVDPSPAPDVDRAAAEVKVVISAFDLNKNFGTGSMSVLAVVTDFKTGKPVTNLAKTNFSLVFVPVNGANACSSNPVIGAFSSNNPGVYAMTIGLPAACAVWPKGQYPIAAIVTSTFNPLILNSPASYQGRTVMMAEVK